MTMGVCDVYKWIDTITIDTVMQYTIFKQMLYRNEPCLREVISRRTLANMTGKRYALLVAPGDHWVHWPDRWFDQTSEPYRVPLAA